MPRAFCRSRAALALALATACGVSAGTFAPAPARAATPTLDPGTFADSIAVIWPGRQRASGAYRDYLPLRTGGDRYGPPMMGYALLDQGARDGNDALIASGAKALSYAARRAYRYESRHRRHTRRTVFNNLALAAAYNLGRESLSGNQQFERIAPLLARTMRVMRFSVIGRAHYYNFKLVEGVAVLELLRSGLRGRRAGTILNRRVAARRAVWRLFNRSVPKIARLYDRGAGSSRTTMISDPPWNPPAYQAFSLALLVRAVTLLGPAATPSLRAAVLAALRASEQFSGPDGDVGYYGRSQALAWVLSSTVYAASAARRFAGASAAASAAALAARAMGRLESEYGGGPYGIFLTPSLRDAAKPPLRGLDIYVRGASYTALTLMMLEWAAHEPSFAAGVQSPLPADAEGVSFIGRGEGTLATVRKGATWFAVHRAPARVANLTALYANDLRYDGGLVAFKVLREDGRWHDVLAPLPKTTRVDSAGPTLRRHGRLWRPVGRRITASRHGAITIDGELRDVAGHPAGRRMRMIVAPDSCGVTVSFGTHAGERTQYSVFFRGKPAVDRGAVTRLAGPGETVYVDPPAPDVTLQGGYSSGVDPGLVRARLTFKSRKTRRQSVTICPDGVPAT